MPDTLVCWRCGASVEGLPQPLARLADCPACHADLHVCRMCVFFDRGVARSCREPIADEVQDKDRANFCGYFKARPHAYRPADTAASAAARMELEGLFGLERPAGEAAPGGSPADALARLFGLDPGKGR
jgi:hypothetical protein